MVRMIITVGIVINAVGTVAFGGDHASASDEHEPSFW
jgi:hypothetical protein